MELYKYCNNSNFIYFAGPMQLRCHCLYILIIAVNGITECFMFATMSQSAVDEYNNKLVLFSTVFLASSWFLTRFGAVGFIFANCLNMILRIIHRYSYQVSNCCTYYYLTIKELHWYMYNRDLLCSVYHTIPYCTALYYNISLWCLYWCTQHNSLKMSISVQSCRPSNFT